jgi:hypothetical protein
MKVSIDFQIGGRPKRGDILQTNIGDRKRERTLLILRTHRLKPINGVPRYSVWAERWWYMEPDMRMRLFESAERAGGQLVILFRRPTKTKDKKKEKKNLTFEQYFEQYMRRAAR